MAAAAVNWAAYLVHLGFTDAVREQVIAVQGFNGPDAFATATKSEIDDLVTKVALYSKFIEMTNTGHTQARGSRANVIRIGRYYMGLSNYKNSYKDIPDYPEPYKNSFGMLEDVDD